MSTYRVTLEFTRDQFLRFVESVPGKLSMTVESVREAEAEPVAAPKTRGPRGSKVNDTILETLKAGPSTVAGLKQALEAKGLSAGSLSTGIAALQKNDRIRRGDNGYELAA